MAAESTPLLVDEVACRVATVALRFDRLLAPLAALLVFVIAWMQTDANVIGMWQDDALYLSAAESIAAGDGPVLRCVPGGPALTKYPPLYAYFLALWLWIGGAHGVALVLVVQALTLALGVGLSVGLLFRRLGLDRAERVAAAALLITNATAYAVSTTTMSEPLFTLFIVCLLIVIFRKSRIPGGSLGPPVGVAVLAMLATLTRTAGVIACAGMMPILVWRRRWGDLGAMVLGIASAMAIGHATREPARQADARPLTEIAGALAYYTSYDLHLVPYRDAWAEGGASALASTALATASSNGPTGLRGLAGMLAPLGADPAATPFRGSVNTAIGAALLVIIALGFAGLRDRAMLTGFATASVLFFTFWTWPFTSRFLAPLLPVLVAALVTGLRRVRLRGVTFTLVVAMLALLQLPSLVLRATRGDQSRAIPGSPSAPLEIEIAWLRDHTDPARGDVIVGPFSVLWRARQADGLAGLWLEALLAPRVFLERGLAIGTHDASDYDVARPLVEGLHHLRAFVPPQARLLVIVDPTLPVDVSRLVGSLAREGFLRPTGPPGGGWSRIFEVPPQ